MVTGADVSKQLVDVSLHHDTAEQYPVENAGQATVPIQATEELQPRRV